MTTIEILTAVQDLSFSHNRETVDVHAFDSENNRIVSVKNVSAELFLNHFEYGQCLSDDREQNIEFMKIIL